MAAKKGPKDPVLAGVISVDMSQVPKLPGDLDRIKLAAETLEVKDDATFKRAAELLKTCAERITLVETEYEQMRVLTNLMHKEVTGKIKKYSGPYVKLRDLLEEKMKPFRLAQIESAKQVQNEIHLAGTELKQELTKQAEEARMVGNIKLARELERQAEEVVTYVIVADTKPDVDGLGERMPWKGVCKNVMQLIAAVAEGRVPLMHTVVRRGGATEELPIIEVNPVVLTYLAKRKGENLALPGCVAELDLQFVNKGD